jgi:hypothetical protein
MCHESCGAAVTWASWMWALGRKGPHGVGIENRQLSTFGGRLEGCFSSMASMVSMALGDCCQPRRHKHIHIVFNQFNVTSLCGEAGKELNSNQEVKKKASVGLGHCTLQPQFSRRETCSTAPCVDFAESVFISCLAGRFLPAALT